MGQLVVTALTAKAQNIHSENCWARMPVPDNVLGEENVQVGQEMPTLGKI